MLFNLDSNKLKQLTELEVQWYQIFIKICFYIDTMFNYEIEYADWEFFKDDEGDIWLLKMENVKANIKTGWEEHS